MIPEESYKETVFLLCSSVEKDFTIQDIANLFLEKKGYSIKNSSVRGALYALLKKGLIKKTGNYFARTGRPMRYAITIKPNQEIKGNRKLPNGVLVDNVLASWLDEGNKSPKWIDGMVETDSYIEFEIADLKKATGLGSSINFKNLLTPYLTQNTITITEGTDYIEGKGPRKYKRYQLGKNWTPIKRQVRIERKPKQNLCQICSSPVESFSSIHEKCLDNAKKILKESLANEPIKEGEDISTLAEKAGYIKIDELTIDFTQIGRLVLDEVFSIKKQNQEVYLENLELKRQIAEIEKDYLFLIERLEETEKMLARVNKAVGTGKVNFNELKQLIPGIKGVVTKNTKAQGRSYL